MKKRDADRYFCFLFVGELDIAVKNSNGISVYSKTEHYSNNNERSAFPRLSLADKSE